MKTRRAWYDFGEDLIPVSQPSCIVMEPEDDSDDRWTGLYDANGERILYEKPRIGFFDFDLMRAVGLLPPPHDEE